MSIIIMKVEKKLDISCELFTYLMKVRSSTLIMKCYIFSSESPPIQFSSKTRILRGVKIFFQENRLKFIFSDNNEALSVTRPFDCPTTFLIIDQVHKLHCGFGIEQRICKKEIRKKFNHNFWRVFWKHKNLCQNAR